MEVEMDVEHIDRINGVWTKYDHHFPPLPSALDSSEAPVTLDDSDGDDNFGACFQCPFCYLDIEVRALNIHLEEDHCFDMKNAVCPVCAANFGRDLTAHLTVQHGHLLKRRKFHRLGLLTNGLSALGKDLEKLLFFLGVASTKSKQDCLDSTSDHSISPSAPALKRCQKATPGANAKSSPNTSTTESESNMSDINQLENEEEMIQRAQFYRELIVSTIF